MWAKVERLNNTLFRAPVLLASGVVESEEQCASACVNNVDCQMWSFCTAERWVAA